MIQTQISDCLVKLRSEYASLNPATKKVAEYILNNPGDVIEYNIVDLAEKIQVSSYSIISCIKAIGYSGYKDFKIALAQTYDPARTTLFEGITAQDDPLTIYVKTLKRKMRSLAEMENLISADDMQKVVNMIIEADRIEMYAIGYSKYAAEMLCTSLRRIGKNTAYLSDPHLQQMSAVMLTKNDLAIGVSTSGKSYSVVKGLDYAKEAGAKTVAITSIARSPITECADLTLFTTYSDPMLIKDTISSAIEQIALVSALLLAVAHVDAPHALVNLSETSAVIGLSAQNKAASHLTRDPFPTWGNPLDNQ